MQDLARSAERRNKQFDGREELTPLGDFNLKGMANRHNRVSLWILSPLIACNRFVQEDVLP